MTDPDELQVPIAPTDKIRALHVARAVFSFQGPDVAFPVSGDVLALRAATLDRGILWPGLWQRPAVRLRRVR